MTGSGTPRHSWRTGSYLSRALHPTRGSNGPIEQWGVPLISKMDDLRLVVDAVRLALLRRAETVGR